MSAPPEEPAGKPVRSAAREPRLRPQIEVDLKPSADGAAFEAWRGYLAPAGRTELVDPDSLPAFHASAKLFVLSHLVFSEASASHACRLVRTPEDAVRTGIDNILISLHLKGTYAGDHDGKPFLARAGDISVLDYARPFAYEISPFHTLALTVPRRHLPEAMRGRALHGLVPGPRRPATQLLARMMRAFAAALPRLTEAEGIAAARAVVDLAESATCYAARTVEARPSVALVQYDRARAEIARHLGRADLSPESLAKTLGVSRGALYKLFEAQGGVRTYIRECRLRACYEIFAIDLRAEETIGAIAASLGFASEAHFSRTFKERYGMSPRALRALGRERRVAIAPSRPDSLPSHLMGTLGD